MSKTKEVSKHDCGPGPRPSLCLCSLLGRSGFTIIVIKTITIIIIVMDISNTITIVIIILFICQTITIPVFILIINTVAITIVIIIIVMDISNTITIVIIIL